MADATATALGGLVRSQRRAGTLSRGCWRLVVLLGLSWVALLLLGGTAHAAEDPVPAAPRGQALPLIGQVLANVDTVTEALPVSEVTAAAAKTVHGLNPRDVTIPEPVADIAGTAGVPGAAAAPGAQPAPLPVLDALDTVTAVAGSVDETAAATTSGGVLLDVKLPSITDTVAPIVNSAAGQLDTTAQLLADNAQLLAVPLPLASPLPGVLDSVASTIDRATDVLASASVAVTTTADNLANSLTGALAPLLDVVAGPAGSIGISVGGGSSAPAATSAAPDLGLDAASDASSAGGTTPATAGQHVDVLRGTAAGGPAVPPPDATNDSTNVVAQPATDIVTAVAVPVSAAGSTTGTGGSTPTPSPDQTLVRVDTSEPEFEVVVTKPIEGPAGPMPGTPSADPAFSPD